MQEDLKQKNNKELKTENTTFIRASRVKRLLSLKQGLEPGIALNCKYKIEFGCKQTVCYTRASYDKLPYLTL